MARKKATPARRKRPRKAVKARRAARRPQPRRGRSATRARKRAKAARRRPARMKARAKGAARIKAKTRAPRRTSPKARPAGSLRLERERRRLPDVERLEPGQPLSDARLLSSARAGHGEMKAMRERHTQTTPALTAGELDAKWEDAYAVGDEAPGGDNPTPDQDRVDDIGKALGIQYQDDQELEGGEEVTKRDRHRWELDPASSEDWPHEKKKPR